MAKTWTQRNPKARDFTKAEDYNAEARGIMAQFNGNIGSQQLPMNAFTEDKFDDGDDLDSATATRPDGTAEGTCQRLPSQTYARVSSTLAAFTSGNTSTILAPSAAVYDNTTNYWPPGFIPLSNKINKGVYLRVPCQGGILKGCAMVDIEYYLGDKGQYDGGSPGTPVGQTDWRFELAVFVDNILVMRTSMHQCQRHTFALPFAVPVPARDVVVDVRWRAKYNGDGATGQYELVADTSVKFYNTTLWCRNVYR